MNPFDAMQSAAFAAALATFGQDARWTPATGGATRTGRVLFNAPTGTQRLSGVDYSPLEPVAEYWASMFPGLKSSSDQHNVERLVIGNLVYFVTAVEAVHDGVTMRAKLVFDPQSSETPEVPAPQVSATQSLAWYRFVQEQPATIWVIDHPLNRAVSVYVTDLDNTVQILPAVEIDPSNNYRVRLYFDEPTTGIATLT